MRIPDSFLEELKSRLRPSDVIGKSVKLRRQGREYAGLSPFTKEKSPSFFVNDDKGFYHCFSSGKHGDLISFLQETERLTFHEAVERLAGEAGLAMPEPDQKTVEQERRRATLTDWLDLAAAWYQAELRRPAGAEARAYLEKRGLPEAEWSRFGIGYAPGGRTALKDYLVAKGAHPAALVDAGLLIQPEDGSAPYDRFRDRIMFPIADGRGRLVSFGGRAMDKGAKAKYLNGPETDVFQKSHVLYGLPEARRLLHAGQAAGVTKTPMVVVEGYMDVIACHRASVPAVAAMGTSLTEEQMETLWRLHPEPTLCFDGDKAGQRAASRAIDKSLPLLRSGRSFRFTHLVGGKDPDDILKDKGPEVLRAQLQRTIPFVEALFVRERDSMPLQTPEQKVDLKKRLRAAADLINDVDLGRAYRDDLLGRMEKLFPRQAPQTRSAPGKPADAPWRRQEAPKLPPVQQRGLRPFNPFHAAVALGAATNPTWASRYDEALERVGFGDPDLKSLAMALFLALVDGMHDETPFLELARMNGLGDVVKAAERAAGTINAPFLDSRTDPDVARKIWSRCYEAVIEVTDAERALEALHQDVVTSATMSAIRVLRERLETVRGQISDLAFWDQD